MRRISISDATKLAFLIYLTGLLILDRIEGLVL